MNGVVRKVLHSVAGVALAGFISSVGLVATANPAAAAPTSCRIWKTYGPPGQVEYRCDRGSGYYRAMAYCSRNPGGWGNYYWGPWVGTGTGVPSFVQCPRDLPYLVAGTGEAR